MSSQAPGRCRGPTPTARSGAAVDHRREPHSRNSIDSQPTAALILQCCVVTMDPNWLVPQRPHRPGKHIGRHFIPPGQREVLECHHPSHAVSGRKALVLVELILADRPMPPSNDCQCCHIQPGCRIRHCGGNQRMSVRRLVVLRLLGRHPFSVARISWHALAAATSTAHFPCLARITVSRAVLRDAPRAFRGHFS